jgi:D-glycero-alpha-D-manno-heptose-7-phosphate kinase
MIITQTPLRISFWGGGTDYPAYYRVHGGSTLAMAIDKYTVITVQRLGRFANCNFRLNYSSIENVQTLDEIKHPSARECLRFMGLDREIEIHYMADLPARTGLGSSSSATVGLLHALHAFRGEMVGREQLAEEAIHVEQNMIKERVGSQDQYSCALGGLRHFQFRTDGSIIADPVTVSAERLQALSERLVLCYSGVQRHAHEILDEQLSRTQSGEINQDLGKLQDLVRRGIEILTSDCELSEFGKLLHEGWMIKRGLSTRIATNHIDTLYENAQRAGALGGKLLGAGGGGFMVFFVEPQNRERLLSVLPEGSAVRFNLDWNGSRVIYYQKEAIR